eukprot:634820-Pleurochrysis_carterae.AAC.1
MLFLPPAKAFCRFCDWAIYLSGNGKVSANQMPQIALTRVTSRTAHLLRQKRAQIAMDASLRAI